MDKLEITNARKQFVINNVCMDGSTFTNVSGKALQFDDVNLTGTRIKNANLSDIEIKGAQLGGAYIHNIFMPPKGHALYNADAKHRALRFENCDLNNSSITDCNLSGVSINNCNVEGMMINGVPVEELFKVYASSKG